MPRSERGARVLVLTALVTAVLASPSAGRLIFVDEEKQGVAGVDGLTAARGVMVSPDGRHVYAIGTLDDAITSFDRNAATGSLTFKQILRDGADSVSGLDGPLQLALSPDGLFVYVVTQVDSIAIFRREPSSGLLAFVTADRGEGDLSLIAFPPRCHHQYAGIATLYSLPLL